MRIIILASTKFTVWLSVRLDCRKLVIDEWENPLQNVHNLQFANAEKILSQSVYTQHLVQARVYTCLYEM
eukprot:COSAG02_NODE_18760_length_920_cov_22.911084_2_plen_70_part_00